MLNGKGYALRPCASCGECLWVDNSSGQCADCDGRSRPTITQSEIDADTAKTSAMIGALIPLVVDSEGRRDQFVAAFAEAKKKWARYNAFQRYGVCRCEYTGVKEAYAAVIRLLYEKLQAWYSLPAPAVDPSKVLG